MVRRILTFALAGILAFETPATAYAAESDIRIETTNETEHSAVEGEGGVLYNSSTNTIGNSEDTDSNGSAGNIDNNETADGSVEDAVNNSSNEDNDNNGGASNPENGDESIDIGDADHSGDTAGSDNSDNREETGTDGDADHAEDSDISDGIDSGDNTDDLSGEETDDLWADEADEAEDGEGNASVSENDSSVSGNTVLAMADVGDVSPSENAITEISYEEAKNNGVTISAPDSRESSAWYSFTAPRAGRYAFYTDSVDCEGTGYIYVNLYTAPFDSTRNHWAHFDPNGNTFVDYWYLWINTDYMEAGETVYIETYVKDKAGRTFTLKAADQTEAEADADGVSSLVLENGDRLTFRAQAGCERLRFHAEADYVDKSSEGRYFIRPYWGPADHSEGDQDVGDVSQTSKRNLYLRAWKECEGEVESGTVAQATTYDVSYMVMYTPEEDLRKAQFVALLSGTQCVTKEKGADDWLYIHDDECTDHSIVLDVEPFPSQGGSSKNIYCYYAPMDGTEPEQFVLIDKYKRYEFPKLRAGTEYRFDFRTSEWGESLKSVTYRTTGTPVEIKVYDYEADLSEDFRSLYLRAKTNYVDGDRPVIHYSFQDALGTPHTDKIGTAAYEETAEEISLRSEWEHVTECVFLPNETYELKVWMEFRAACITTEPVTVLLHTPEKAFYGEDEITLKVTRDSDVRTTVNCEFQLPPSSRVPRCYLYYKPEGETRYTLTSKALDWAYSGPESIVIKGLQSGTEYDFALFLGGVVTHCSLNLNESGMKLTRVEDKDTDFESPYDFTHTYRLSGTEGALSGEYYLRLQYVSADKWDNYRDAGTAVCLNEANQYQTAFSSAGNTSLWFDSDGEYYLRWLVGKSKNVNIDNAECCLYEKMTTPSAAPLQIEESGYMEYRVTLNEQDVAGLKMHDRSREFRAYIRREGASSYTEYPSKYTFSAANNYSCILTGLNLAFNSRYELLIANGVDFKIAEGILVTGDDAQKLRIDSVNAMVTVADLSYTIQGIDPNKRPLLILYFRKSGSVDWEWKYYTGYANGKITLGGLQDSTEYEYKIGLGASSTTPINELTCLQEGSFTTHEETRQISLLSVRPRMADVSITCSVSGMENSVADDSRLVLWIRPAVKGTGQTGWWRGTDTKISKNNAKVEIGLNRLVKETEYEYRIGLGREGVPPANELAVAIEGTFTTTPDPRKVTVTATPGIYRAVFDCVVSGVESSGYLICYFREDTEEGTWHKAEAKSVSESSSSVLLRAGGLQENARYQYKIGFGKTANVEADALEQPMDGAFSTNPDTREVAIASSPRVISADIAYTLNRMEYTDDDYLCGYIREKDDTGEAGGENAVDSNRQATVAWEHQFSVPVNNRSMGGSVKITGLKADTEYEMIVGFGAVEDCGTDQLIHTKTIELTTLEDVRKVSEAKANVKETSVILSALFEGNIEPQASYVIFFYKTKDEKNWHKVGYVTNASGVESRECSATLTGLVRDAEYDFAAVVADSSSGVSDPDSVTDINKKATGEFKTTPAVAPVSVTLLQENLYLNVGEAYRNEKGYGYEELKVSWSPDKITKDFVWESSNPDVATVSEDGKVTAAAPGIAEITVASLYNPEATDTCHVVVNNYQIGHLDDAGNITWQDKEMFEAVKGQRYSGYSLYDPGTGTPVELADITVVSDNETVASWNEGEIAASQVGTAKLIFAASDSVKAYMTVNVSSVPGKGFDIIGFTASNSNYPAVQEEEKDEERVQYTLACKSGLTYTAVGEIMPGTTEFVNGDFTWSIDDTAVAEVTEEGVVSPKAAGKAVLRVTPKDAGQDGGAPYTGQTCEITLQIKELASEQLVNATPVYALANISSKIGDVRMPPEKAWEGWQWEEPNTPIIINGVNRASYPFRAVYTGEEYYPEEKTINVYIAKVTGMSVFEDADPGHNNVVEVSTVDENGDLTEDSDRLALTVESLYYGRLNPYEETNYYYDVDVTAPANVIVQKEGFQEEDYRLCKKFNITAVKPGNYTLTAVIKVKDKNNSHEKILAKKTYKLKAVAGKMAYVKLVPENADDVILENDRIIINSDKNVTSFDVYAELTDRNSTSVGDFSAVKIAWSVTDKKVIAVKPSKDTHSAEITVKGEGHAILTAKVKDAAGHTDSLRIEIQNKMPRINTEKVNVNLAYDYDTTAGRNLAKASSGMVEIVPAYGEKVESVTLYDGDGETICSDLLMVNETAASVCKLLIRDSKTTKTGTYDCVLGVKTNGRSEAYFYPLRVTVKDEQAKVTAKSNRAVNLFYRSDPASVDIAVPGSCSIESVVWESGEADQNHGFSAGTVAYEAYDTFKKANNVERFYFKQGDIQLTDKNKPADLNAFSGKVKVKVQGYKEPNEGVKVSFKWNYKKPAIVTKAASATLIPTMTDHNVGRFDLYNSTDKKTLLYNKDSATQQNPKYYYSELSCDNDSVKFLPNSSTLGWRRYTYTGSKTKGSEKLTLTIRNADWREPVYAVHTVKLAAPVPYLTNTQLTLNTMRIGTVYTEIGLKNAYDGNLNCDNIIVEGGNPKAKALLAEDLLEISQDSAQKNRVVVKVNRAETMDQAAIANGTYPFKVTPCYTDAYGNIVRAKTLNLKIKVTNKAVTAKVKVSGKLDLTKEIGNNSSNYISLKTTFKNIGSNYTIKSNMRLYGEYSNYFDLRILTNYPGQYRLRIKQDGKLKAGQRYKLALGYTIVMENGDTFTVRSQTFTVTPKQSQPKIKISDNNQTLYAAADTLYRTYKMEVLSEGGYIINDVSGSLDCNKDGKADLKVYGLTRQTDSNTITFRVAIADRDGIMTVTGVKGKTYTIPVVVQLKGRDGITKDLKTQVKVTVKR